ncbi:cysteine hydrolase family protein [Montanilutibacter psychrotolerans]|uniref:Cysteine hydrolase n=1 Tax=Montanilutibacter psychrotolerans TaxID=1327343 RepID=A0A3M8SXJ7_9GAMM|nr:cysteine hydrolase family protein [Lysobacter psychrotolerans]RNF86019.1 cysteine hydrolase [Lysobacter psychrotolerans]
MDRKRALIVIDVQNEYFTGGLPIEYPPVSGSVVNIGRAMDAAKAAGIPVVVFQHTEPSDSPVFGEGQPGWELHPTVGSRPRDHYLRKQWPSVFTGTGLREWLSERGVDTITVVGYMTHNCDASTAFEAAHSGLQVEFLADASGSLPYENEAGAASAEEIHRVFSVVFQSRFAAVLDTDRWIELASSGEGSSVDNPLSSNRRARDRRAQAA